MARSLATPGNDPSYLEFFGLTQPPFAHLERPSHIFDTEQYSLLTAYLARAAEQPDCLVVICGADGSGKTTLLAQFISGFADNISFATIDESCTSEKQFYCAFLRQLGFSDITGTVHELRCITREFLVHSGMAGDPVLMLIDNAHLINQTIIEQLLWVSAIRVRGRRVLSLVLAGNSDLARVIDSPPMSQIKFRNHVQFNLRVYTEEETANYVWHHLTLAGSIDGVKFMNGAHPLIYRHTGGIPNLINMLCNDVLTEACTRKSHVITADLVRTVAENRRLPPHAVPLQGKGQRRAGPDFNPVRLEQQTEERLSAEESTTKEPVEQPTSLDDTAEIDGNNLLEQVSSLAELVGELRADRLRALQDIDVRDKDISELRNKLDAQIASTEGMTSASEDNAAAIGRLSQAPSDSTKALQKSERTSKKLATDLKQERCASKTAKTEISEAKATAKELSHLKSELQTAVRDLTAAVKLADERAREIIVLEKKTAALEISVSERDARIADLNAELASFSQIVKAIKAGNGELASADSEAAQAKGNSLLETASRPDSAKGHSGAIITEVEVDRNGIIEQVMKVTEGQSSIMIGRSEDCDLRLNSKNVSRHHALICCTEEGIYIEDLNSSNGTIVNSKTITRRNLRASDIVTIGGFQITTRQA